MTIDFINQRRYDQIQRRMAQITRRLRLGTDTRAQLLTSADVRKLETEKARLNAESMRIEAELEKKG